MFITDGNSIPNVPFIVEHERVFNYSLQVDDFSFKSKYSINSWSNIKYYDNILYLDCDVLCLNSVDKVFDAIENNKDFLNGVIEHICFNESGHYYRFKDIKYDEKTPAYNAGSFGFNKKLLYQFDLFLDFITLNSQYVLTEQPLFNEFFISKNLLSSDISSFVYLDCDCENHLNINSSKKVKDITFLHALGGYENVEKKFVKMKNILNSKKKENNE